MVHDDNTAAFDSGGSGGSSRSFGGSENTAVSDYPDYEDITSTDPSGGGTDSGSGGTSGGGPVGSDDDDDDRRTAGGSNTGYDGQKTRISGPEAAGNETGTVKREVLDKGGDEGQAVFDSGDDPFTPDDRAGLEETKGIGSFRGGREATQVQRFQQEIGQQVPGVSVQDTHLYNIERGPHGRLRAETTDELLQQQGQSLERQITRENSRLGRDDLQTTFAAGGVQVQETDQSLRERAAQQNPETLPSDYTVTDTRRGKQVRLANPQDVARRYRSLGDSADPVASGRVTPVNPTAEDAPLSADQAQDLAAAGLIGGGRDRRPNTEGPEIRVHDLNTQLSESERRNKATQTIERRLEEKYGVRLEEGEDFTVEKQSSGTYEGTLTDNGKIKIQSRVETGETWLDENVINPALGAIGASLASTRSMGEPMGDVGFSPGPGDTIQQIEADLRRHATIHRTGRGLLPNAAQAEEFGEKYAAPGLELVGAVGQYTPYVDEVAEPLATGDTAERVAGGFYSRLGQTVNPAGIVLGGGKLVEGAGEYSYNVALSGGPSGREPVAGELAVPGTDQTLGEVSASAEESQQAQEAAAGVAVSGLIASTEESIRERPVRTAGSGLFEAGTLLAGEALSPIRLGKARIATVSDDVARGARIADVGEDAIETTTYRGVVFDAPRAFRRGPLKERYPSPVVGAAGTRPVVGTPDVGDLATGHVPRTPLETEIFRETASGDLEGAAPGELFEAEHRVRQLGRMVAGRQQTVRSAEGAIGQAKRIPEGAEGDIVRYLDETDAVLGGSAGQATAVGRTRLPADVDIYVDNPQQAARDLADIVERYSDRPVHVTGSGNVRTEGGAHLFDIQRKADRQPGTYYRYGRRSEEPVETAEGVRVEPISEQLQRKATASMIAQGEGVRATRLGPEPHRAKDVFDTSVLGRELIEQERSTLRGRFDPFRRRKLTEAERAMDQFEAQLSDELAQAQAQFSDELMDRPAGTRAGVAGGITGAVDTDALARRLFGEAERGQVTPADILPERVFQQMGVDTREVNRVLDDLDAQYGPRGGDIEYDRRRYYDEPASGRDAGVPASSGGAGRLESGDMASDLESQPSGGRASQPAAGEPPVDIGAGSRTEIGAYAKPGGGRDYESPITTVGSGGGFDIPTGPGYGEPTYSVPIYTVPSITGFGSGAFVGFGGDLGWPGSGRRPRMGQDQEERRRGQMPWEIWDHAWINPVASAATAWKRTLGGSNTQFSGLGEEELMGAVREDLARYR